MPRTHTTTPALGLACALLGLVPACGIELPAPPSRARLVHANGMTLDLPSLLSARPTPDGFIVHVADSDARRDPIEVSLTRHTDAQRPPGEWPWTRQIAGRVAYYRAQQSEGGSGGPGHMFTAWTPYPGGYLRAQQVSQTEWPESPDHALTWVVLASIAEP